MRTNPSGDKAEKLTRGRIALTLILIGGNVPVDKIEQRRIAKNVNPAGITTPRFQGSYQWLNGF